MGYVAVKGGTQAIEESIKRLKYERLKKGVVLDCHSIEGGLRCLIDQVMSESSLYNETLAALAIKQAEGSPEEAVFLLRAYRSTLPRRHYSRTVESEDMLVERRISASFKDIPGGQILGAATDYTHRLIDFNLNEETDQEAIHWVREYSLESGVEYDKTDLAKLPKVLDYLREEGLIQPCKNDDSEPDDVTKESLQFPTSRSERLQILTRGQTGAVTSLGYVALRSYGALHPTVGELRIGNLPLYVDNPFNELSEGEDAYYIGEIKVTEVESLFPEDVQKLTGQKELEFSLGYGICYGQNESKAIAISILDRCLETDNPEHSILNEEFILLHIDSVESTGFISHLKLPHYVTFQSKLDSVRKSKKGKEGLTDENH
ncbi:carbon-phosphorus lyase complex subunit PhnI [Desulfosporosinus sp. BICA1-9]|uniref:carbon-phosphorus lyase complex subunit PhnI n=1 Tax=Desulfosporosinus sp. BICA1-9 TaxID=1531958 RepID=UPI00054B6D3B|nr:carbon-phosphorus lyase complex subunit PhnI [Desulfosporosinus sp. BICA1-9]KJS49656.1 MAG: carbon-phosphorus lyase [Peptococcaceae bacterium BRH_c23]KJS88457.1 MAG: carbon-phosphorus lyase [Desulfosporosinus sp. BICA1-9]HBW34699.1 carbon-phosphorus lyase [Desulfosporosinus sp.]